MKQNNYFFKHPNNLILYSLFSLLPLFSTYTLSGQTDLTCDGTEDQVNYNGSYQDFTVPSDVSKTHIYFKLQGADGGKAATFTSSTGKGGEGAIIEATFPIGEGADSIPPGSTIRFIIGQKGLTRNSGTLNSGTGGGGSAILLKEPDSTNWELLMVAGGGGGGWSNTVTNRDGRGGRAGENGGDGADGDTNGDNGGTGGNGGKAAGNSGGGGGAWDRGGHYTCHNSSNNTDNAGGGEAGWYDGTPDYSQNPTGGDGGCGSCNCTPNEGFGFGGGGYSTEQAGGGGGGYSGGGGGGNAAGGGGGGSYVSALAIASVKTAGDATGSPDNGKAWYRCVDPPTAVCTDYSFSIGTENDQTVSTSDIDNGSSSDVAYTLSLSPNTFDCNDIGDNTVTLTLQDEAIFEASCTATVTVSDEASGFTDLTDDDAFYTINHSSSYQDFLIPENTTKNSFLVALRGADGGKKRNTSTFPCAGGTGRGGRGATITTLFNIGTGADEIPPGSIVRFIVGEKGTSVNGAGGIEGAGGGGGTAVLYREDEGCDWTLLAVAGGGGGGWSDGCFDISDGQGGRTTTSGGDGRGNSTQGSGGNNGNGGGAGSLSGVEYSAGGGGAFQDGTPIDCTGNPDWGDGKKGGTTGGAGGSDGGSCGSGRDGGYGFGGGGLGDGSGGGGGGYSGGGGGGPSGGGGGGGSYINDISSDQFSNIMDEGGNTASPQHGYVKYSLQDRTNPVAICNPNANIDVSHTSSSDVLASTIDNNSYDPEGGALTYDVSPNPFNCSDLGNQIVTLTVTDETQLTSSCTAQVIVSYNVSSITELNDNGSEHTISYSGSYIDRKIPDDTEYSEIKLFARGGDGGKREIGDCLAKGGQGADVEATFTIGCGNNEIPPGSILRFIPGEEGKSTNGGGIEGSGGGGGSGILYKAPGDCTWHILIVAGGGGGAFLSALCIDKSSGKEANASESGSSGKGSNSGGGGSNGNGGNRTLNTAGGGGGAFGNGEEIGCGVGNNWGGGKKGAYQGGQGGQDGSGGCGSGRNGGFGFGGGGLGDGSGGGGGGYSGGGAGGASGGGGGGGSYVNPMATSSSKTERGTDGSPNDGFCKYEFDSDTNSDIDNAPNALCKNITVSLDENGNALVYPPEVDNGSTDDCGNNYLRFYFGTSQAYRTFSCSNSGATFNVTLRVVDYNGNSDNCSASITLTESEVPVASCRDVTVDLDNSGTGTLAATDVDNGSTDNCGINTRTLSKTNFTTSDIGTQTITLTITDDNSNSSTCSATVTVEQSITINAVCQNAAINLESDGNGSITTSDIDNGSSASLGIASLSLSNSSFNCSNVGSNTVTLTVNDTGGNTSTCSATVSVSDNTVPTALCSDYTLQLNASGMGNLTTTNVNNDSNDACGIQSTTLSKQNFTCSDVGTQSVTLTVSDQNNNSSTCSASITIEDNVAPQAQCTDFTLQLNASGTGNLAAADIDNGSSDACGAPSLALGKQSFNCSDVGSQSVTLNDTDQNGNSSTCSATVTIEDSVAPMAICQDVTVQLTVAGLGATSANEVDGGSSDACSIQSLSLSKESFNCSDVGTNTVTLTITDNNNNSSSCSAEVSVEDNISPNAVCQSVTVQLNNGGNGTLTALAVDGGSNDACNIQNLSIDQESFNCSHLGLNTVTLTVTDFNNNSNTCTASVTVEDNVAPEAICQSATIQLNNDGNGSIVINDIDNASSDQCVSLQLNLNQTDFDCSHIGSNTVILTATDGSGNTHTCSAMVIVQDSGIPEAICQSITMQLNANGVQMITPEQIDNNSQDACTGLSLSLDISSFDCSDIGGNTVILTTTDGYGNSNSCSATVTVEDQTPPQALCQAQTLQLDDSGNGSTEAAAINASSNDACGISSITLNQTAFDCSDLGKVTVTLTVTDVNNNTSTCSAEVIVEDNVLPIAKCQDVTLELDANGQTGLQNTQVDNNSTDACGISFMQLSQTAFDCSHIGSNIVNLTVHDTSDNTSSCSATVNVVDLTPPNPVCLHPTINFNGEDQIPLTVEQLWNEAATTDNCQETYFVVMSSTEITCDQVGSIVPVTLTIEDGSGNMANCTAMVTVDGLPCNWQTYNDGIACPAGNSADYNAQTGDFTITSQGCYNPAYYRPTDSHGYVGTTLCGDGEISAYVSGITGNTFAGLTMRESLNPSAKMIQIMVNNSGLARREIRTSTGGVAFAHLFQSHNKHWVRLTRSGNQFGAYLSADGQQWDLVFLVNIPMQNCIEVGLITMNEHPILSATATFASVNVSGNIGLGLHGVQPVQDQIHQSQDFDFNLYPNPASDQVNLVFDQIVKDEIEIQVFNHLGQIVFNKNIKGMEIEAEQLDLHHLPGGTYIMKINTMNNTATRKFILSKL